MSQVRNETSAKAFADSAERKSTLTWLGVLCGQDTMLVIDGGLRVRVPLSVYLAHISDEDLATLARDITCTAGIMIRAMARLHSVEFLLWRDRHIPKEVGHVDKIASEFGLDPDRVQRALDDLSSQPVDQPAPLGAGADRVNSEPQHDLAREIGEKALLFPRVQATCPLIVHLASPHAAPGGSLAGHGRADNGDNATTAFIVDALNAIMAHLARRA